MSAKWKEIDVSNFSDGLAREEVCSKEEDNFLAEDLSKSAQRCRAVALKYVAMQIKTEGQVADYLKRKGFDRDDIEIALDFLREYNYVDDKRYCESFFREGALKGKGRRRIEQELEQKKVNRYVIREVLDELLDETNPEYECLMAEVGTEKERGLRVARKMLRMQLDAGKENDKAFMAKVGRRLMAYGYGSEVVYSVLGILMKETKSMQGDASDFEE